VSETRIRPRFELEDASITRLEPEALPVAVAPSAGPGTLTLVGSGAAVLVVGLAALDVGNFVADQFARGALLGGATLGVAVAGFGLLGAAVWRELRGLFGLRRVDHLRIALADPARARPAALAWLAILPEGAALASAVATTDDPAAIAALLRAGPLAALRARADALGRQAALQVFAAAAAVPSPSLDGLLVAWRGTRLVRQVAELHGLRPGLFGTLALLRRVMFSAASVLATDVAANTLANAVLSNPLLEKLAGDVAGAGVAARRMVVLARVTAAACSPLGPG
jgi:uncharacterized membrane protein YcjF (UPF0283 family)